MLRQLVAAGMLMLAAAITTSAAASEAQNATPAASETLTLGGGCFWCLEAVFDELKGVSSVVSGYAGGHVKNPTYEQVSDGGTGHAEVVQITFDPRVVSRDVILQVFFTVHDPTTLNRQGNDVGEQYRSVAFYRDS
jgi:peptide-methionine (S)-S-oxide reductase